MGFECITMDKKDSLARIMINRPDKLNALSIKTVMELTEAFEEIKSDDSISVVIFGGAGDKAFAAGADLNELSKQGMLDGKEYSVRGHRLCNLIENLGKPVIASICGFALGGGCELAMACTLRIASEKARLGQPEVNLGTIPGFGGTQRLPRLIPRGIAMELILTGRVLKADEALVLGLVNKVVPHEELDEAVKALADALLEKPVFALKANMEAVLHGTEVSYEEGCRIETNLFAMTCGTEDMKEGTAAFLEKRKAEFTGR
ncbi:MAG: enoyl-CoA hydratase/isomerase family protein [Candidatus Krumholzibacteriota bacterium]|nr:enoyl-CoA hydratase/isomerase family protein [Candidatus Krumholzibacteriota bacterium]